MQNTQQNQHQLFFRDRDQFGIVGIVAPRPQDLVHSVNHDADELRQYWQIFGLEGVQHWKGDQRCCSSEWPLVSVTELLHRIVPASRFGPTAIRVAWAMRRYYCTAQALRCGSSPDRVAAAGMVLRGNCDAILADDGLKHYRPARDIELAVIDGWRRFGDG